MAVPGPIESTTAAAAASSSAGLSAKDIGGIVGGVLGGGLLLCIACILFLIGRQRKNWKNDSMESVKNMSTQEISGEQHNNVVGTESTNFGGRTNIGGRTLNIGGRLKSTKIGGRLRSPDSQ